MADFLPVSVVVPTVGRLKLLDRCLASIARCAPGPAEVLVVEQSGDEAVREAVERQGARLIALAEANVARARNVGLREAREEVVLFTDDDCTVADDWVRVGFDLLHRDPDRIVTGRVSADGPLVPSIREDPEPYDHTGELRCDALYTNNLAVLRPSLLGFGGFDERLRRAAEDNDLCYRWLRAGRRLCYEPSLSVTHHDWRGSAELAATYAQYWRGQGAFYAKHLRRRDRNVVRFLAADIDAGLRFLSRAAIDRRPRPPTAPRLGHLALGLVGALIPRDAR